MKRKTIIATGIAVAVVAAMGGGYAYSASSNRPLVGVATARVTPLSLSVSASGVMVPARTAGVYPPAAGTLASVKVRDSDTVKAGALLARMNTAGLKLALAQAKAAHSAALAGVEAVNNGVPGANERSAASSAISAARSQSSTATKNYADYLDQYNSAPADQRPAMRATLRTLKTAKATARAALASALANQTKLARAARVSSARTAASQAVAATAKALNQAKDNLAAAELRAPIAGTVTFSSKVEPGFGVTPGVAVFTVVDPTRMEFEAAVNETDIASVVNAQSAEVTLDAFPTPFSGKVTQVQASPTTTNTGTVAFGVRIATNSSSARVFQGMSGSAEIQVQSISEALTVPIESVLTQGSTKSVFVLDGEQVAHLREVSIGVSTDTDAQVLTGLVAGDQVVTTGASALSDGQHIRTK